MTGMRTAVTLDDEGMGLEHEMAMEYSTRGMASLALIASVLAFAISVATFVVVVT